MPDESSGTSPQTELVDEAEALIGTDALWSGQLLYTAVDLGIVDRLASNDPTAADAVADDLALHPDNCYRLLRALSHFGVLAEDDQRRFTLTPVGELFAADRPDSVRTDLLVGRSPEWVRPMQHLGDVVREGDPNGFVREYGQAFFAYLDDNPAFGERFNDHMSARSQRETAVVLDVLRDVGVGAWDHVCDVGGGHGHLLCSLLAEYPHLDGTVLELERVIAEEDRRWAPKLGVEDRCTYEAGDMFEAVPAADAYLMKFILHDWGDEDCVRILSTVRDAAPTDARLYVAEAVVPGPDTPHFAKRLDMTMLVHVGGRERTESEYGSLLGDGGWELRRRWNPDGAPLSVIEAAPA